MQMTRIMTVLLSCAAMSCHTHTEVPITFDAETSEGADTRAALARDNPDAALAPTDAPAAAISGSGLWVTSYYAAYQRDLLAPSDIDWSSLSHIVFTRLKTQGQGNLQLDFDIDATQGPALAREIAKQAHQHGKKALLMLGGEQAGAGIADSSSPDHRALFVRALLQAVDEFGYDGLDLDWEDNIDFDRFVALAQALRAQRPTLILTAPGAAINGNYQTVDRKIATLVQSLDQYNLMTYYPSTAFTGSGWQSWHNAPLSGVKSATPVAIDDSLQRHVDAGVPRNKLGLGIAFYAICYTGSVTAPNQSTESGVDVRGGDNDFPLHKLFATGGTFDAKYRHWDEQAQVPYLTLPNKESHGCRYVSFEDEQSLEAKGKFARSKGYGGAIVWTLNQGWLRSSARAPNALTQALKRGFLDP